jgi:putative hemolysin
MTAASAPLNSIFDSLTADLHLPAIGRRLLNRVLGFSEASQLCASALASAMPHAALLKELSVTCRVSDSDLDQIPAGGPLIVIANHPFGLLEGAILATLLNRVRNDVRFLANRILEAIPEIREMLIPVDTDGNAAANTTGPRRCLNHLTQGGCLVMFPAGRVSHFQPRARRVVDSDWSTSVARMVSALARHGAQAQVVPIFIEGSNSLLFQAAGMIDPDLRTAMLVRELLNKRNRSVCVRIGSPIPARRLLALESPAAQTEYLRWRTYVLASRKEFKPLTALPLKRRRSQGYAEIDAPVDSCLMQAEIDALGADALLSRTGAFGVYIAPASSISMTLREIGRLREMTFRLAGEGTGNASDLDSFDRDYLHLFLWDSSKRQIAGAYRLAPTDKVTRLYTSTLFRYDDRFLNRIGPAIELGRSFIRAGYQKSFAPLLALWKGIGVWVARHPQYKTLFGPVSISNRYQAASRELMVAFLERRSPLSELASMVLSRNGPRQSKALLPTIDVEMDDISEVVSDLEPGRNGIPVLLRQYLKLGGQLLGFNVDPNFSDVVDGLILVDLTRTDPSLLDRYLGKQSAAEFLNYWRP